MTRLLLVVCCVASMVAASAAWAADDWAAKVKIGRSPATLDPGEKGSIWLSVWNVGREPWPDSTIVRVAAVKDPYGNEVKTDTPFSAEKGIGAIPPNQGEGLFGKAELQIQGAAARGVWTIRAWVQIGNRRLEEYDECQIEVTAQYYGNIDVRKYPSKSVIGAPLIFEFDAENTGNVEWEAGEVCFNCRVLSANGATMSEGRALFQKQHKSVRNKDNVPPEGTARYTIKLPSPKKPGVWKLEWQLWDIEKNVAFGQKVVGTVDVAPR